MTTRRPLLREPAHRRQPDAGAATGDDRDLALEPACHGDLSYASVLMKTFLTSVNASSASGPSSRPMPLALKPPNGVE